MNKIEMQKAKAHLALSELEEAMADFKLKNLDLLNWIHYQKSQQELIKKTCSQ